MIANTFNPPYYAVIFTSELNDPSDTTYDKMSDKMLELVQQQEGFLGFDSARSTIGITVSYWKDLNSISNWKNQIHHLEAQKIGQSKWYKKYCIRISKVEREIYHEL